MTVVAVRKYKDRIVMSSDSQTTYGDMYKTEKEAVSADDVGKIFMENGMLIGCSGHVSESTFLKLFAKNHKPKSADADGMLEFLLEFRDWIAKRTAEPAYKLHNCIFIVYEAKIFSCWQMDVQEKTNFWATGSGMFLALAALHLGESPEKAVDIAKQYDLYCGGETKTITLLTN